jgi:FdhE protein
MKADYGQELLSQLKAVKKDNPELGEVVDLQSALAEAQTQVQIQPSIPEYAVETVHQRFGRGVPLLRPQEMALDWQTFSELYRQVCRVITHHRPDLAPQLEILLKLLEEKPENVRALTTAYLENGRLEQDDAAGRGELLALVLNHTLRPYLLAYARGLAAVVEQELWKRARCPICGGEPDLAFLDDESGARHLVCSRCDGSWRFPRTACPFCNASDPTTLSYFPSEDEKYRLYVCESCQRYLKTIDRRKALGRLYYPAQRVSMIRLDVAAREYGYR